MGLKENLSLTVFYQKGVPGDGFTYFSHKRIVDAPPKKLHCRGLRTHVIKFLAVRSTSWAKRPHRLLQLFSTNILSLNFM